MERRLERWDNARIRSLFEHSPDGIIAVAADGIVEEANPAAMRLFKASRRDLIGSPVPLLFAAAQRSIVMALFARVTASNPVTFECELATVPGDRLTVECTVSPIVRDEMLSGLFLRMTEITARKDAETNRRRQLERIRALFACAAATNLTADEQIHLTLDTGCDLLGMDMSAIFDAREEPGKIAFTVDRNPSGESGGPEFIPIRICRLAIATRGPLALEDLRGVPVIGNKLPHEPGVRSFIGVPLELGGTRYGTLCFTSREPHPTFTDYDHELMELMATLVAGTLDRWATSAELTSRAYFDALTGAANRLLLEERLTQALHEAIESQTSCAVLYLDLDKFKAINDTLGHIWGDEILKLASRRMIKCMRGNDTVARVGGDEFVILVPNVKDESHLVPLMERLERSVRGSYTVGGVEVDLGVSIGLAVAPRDGTTAEALIVAADEAMYKVKQAGRASA